MSDLRLALRQLIKSPGFTLVAVFTLALGIGLNTSMFSVINRALLRPLPFPEGNRLVRIFGTSPQSQSWAFAAPYAEDLLSQGDAFAGLGLFAQWSATLAEPGRPAEYLMALRVSPGFLSTLGVRPLLGRAFVASDDHPGSNVVILPHHIWMRFFAGDPAIIGRTVRIDATSMTVVGVLPEDFYAPLIFGPVGILRPLALTPAEREDREQRGLHLVGRLAQGVSIREAQAGLRTVAARLAGEYPREYHDNGIRMIPLHVSGTEETTRDLLLLVVGLAGFVLLIACANLANLQLVRATGRARENAIRAAFGASRLRLVRPLFLESLMLAVCGGGAGLLVAVWCNDWISSRAVVSEGVQMGLPLDGRVLAFAAGVSIVIGLLFGTLPGWLASRVRVHEALKERARGTTASRSHHRLRNALVMGEIALAFTLLAGASFFLVGIDRFISRDPGWNTRELAYGAVALPAATYTEGDENHMFYKNLRDRLNALPTVESTAIGWSLPMWAFLSTRAITVESPTPESNEEGQVAYFNAVLPGYFETLEIPLLEGRGFSDHDEHTAPSVAVINETLARAVWPNESPIGKRLGVLDAQDSGWMEVVGVVRDVGFATNLGTPGTRFQVYRPFAQEPWGYANVAIRTSVPARTMIESLQRVVTQLDADIALAEPSTVRDAMHRSWANFRLITQLLAGFSVLGLLLVALGIYGVMAQVVVRRTPEFGVRLALGAQLHDISWLVLRSSARLTFAGAALGLLGAFALGRILTRVSPDLGVPQVPIIALVAGVLVVVALTSSYLPARRAMRVNPMTALRSE